MSTQSSFRERYRRYRAYSFANPFEGVSASVSALPDSRMGPASDRLGAGIEFVSLRLPRRRTG